MRKALDGLRRLIDRRSMRRFQSGRIRDRRMDEQSAERLQRARENIHQPSGGV
jgi:hypothetical protein